MVQIELFDMRLFVIKQPFFGRQTTTVTHHFPGCANHAMTRHHNNYWIFIIGIAHCPHRFWVFNGSSYLTVVFSAAVSNFLQLLPNLLLKVCSLEPKGQIKMATLSCEVLA